MAVLNDKKRNGCSGSKPPTDKQSPLSAVVLVTTGRSGNPLAACGRPAPIVTLLDELRNSMPADNANAILVLVVCFEVTDTVKGTGGSLFIFIIFISIVLHNVHVRCTIYQNVGSDPVTWDTTNDASLDARVPRGCVLLWLRISLASNRVGSRPTPNAGTSTASGSGTLRALREALLGARYTQDLASTLHTFTGSLPHLKAASAPIYRRKARTFWSEQCS